MSDRPALSMSGWREATRDLRMSVEQLRDALVATLGADVVKRHRPKSAVRQGPRPEGRIFVEKRPSWASVAARY